MTTYGPTVEDALASLDHHLWSASEHNGLELDTSPLNCPNDAGHQQV
ncbi:MAG: hypothetical protein R3344_13075 [Acidobacteriota bacterium]|nr:hypothetical protein [Acidobacteriota bacterium]